MSPLPSLHDDHGQPWLRFITKAPSLPHPPPYHWVVSRHLTRVCSGAAGQAWLSASSTCHLPTLSSIALEPSLPVLLSHAFL